MNKRQSKYNPNSDKKWNEKNREHRNYLSSRSSARGFIRNKATIEDVEELKQLIKLRQVKLKNETEAKGLLKGGVTNEWFF